MSALRRLETSPMSQMRKQRSLRGGRREGQFCVSASSQAASRWLGVPASHDRESLQAGSELELRLVEGGLSRRLRASRPQNFMSTLNWVVKSYTGYCLMIGTPTSSETVRNLLNLRPMRASNGKKSRPVCPVTGGPKFQRTSGLG